MILSSYKDFKFNIEDDSEFVQKYEEFLKTPIEENIKISSDEFNKMFEDIYDYLMSVDISKFKWIIFSFIKWNHLYLQNDYIIIENLLCGINNPAIIDFKLGKKEKVGKEKSSLEKILNSTSFKYGFRIMGSQVFSSSNKSFNLNNKLFFKDKYYCRNIKEDNLHIEIIDFFSVCTLIVT